MPTYMELYNAATGDTTTRSRVMVAISKYARFLVGGGQQGASTGRLAWAAAAIANTGAQADQLMWAVVGDPAYQSAGAGITDAALQSALEAAVNAIYP
jgi:hypothetical protein